MDRERKHKENLKKWSGIYNFLRFFSSLKVHNGDILYLVQYYELAFLLPCIGLERCSSSCHLLPETAIETCMIRLARWLVSPKHQEHAYNFRVGHFRGTHFLHDRDWNHLYCCTVYFEDSLSITQQRMHKLYIIY